MNLNSGWGCFELIVGWAAMMFCQCIFVFLISFEDQISPLVMFWIKYFFQ